MYFDYTLAWRAVSQEEYTSKASNFEKCYYIHTENGVPYLRADIEYGGEVQLRVELMNFALVPKDSDLSIHMNISDLAVDCRGYYVGGICFIEYNTWDEADDNVLNDFLNVHTMTQPVSPVYIICRDDALNKIVEVFPNADIFLLVENCVVRR